MPDPAGIYRYFPYWAKVAAASLWGLRLRWWRYSAETERLVQEALERDTWDQATWEQWQARQLEGALDRAATLVPYYREYWSNRKAKRADWLDLSNWPITRKVTVHEKPGQFLAAPDRGRRLFRMHTSGTTGTPLQVFASRDTLVHHYALSEARIRRWNNVSLRDRWAILGGQMVVAGGRDRPPFWVRNLALNQLYLSSHHVSANTAPDFCAVLREFHPTHMVVFPSSASVLAGEILKQGIPAPAIDLVITNAEGVTKSQRADISQAFSCTVRETYGQAEMVAMASECRFGGLHVWPESGYLEVLEDDSDKNAPHGKVGRLVATGLLNQDMMLVRYEVGDRLAIASPSNLCACGRYLPLLEKIEGRASDCIITPDGRRVFWLNPVFYDLPVREAQIVQESRDALIVKVVEEMGFDSRCRDEIDRRLKDRLGELDIKIESVNQVPRGPNGKFRSVISKVVTSDDLQHCGTRTIVKSRQSS